MVLTQNSCEHSPTTVRSTRVMRQMQQRSLSVSSRAGSADEDEVVATAAEGPAILDSSACCQLVLSTSSVLTLLRLSCHVEEWVVANSEGSWI